MLWTVPTVDWDTRDGDYRARPDEQWVVVPDDRVITQPNRVGRAIVWPQYLNSKPILRCFMPGTVTSCRVLAATTILACRLPRS
jgi:hypothetical protein